MKTGTAADSSFLNSIPAIFSRLFSRQFTAPAYLQVSSIPSLDGLRAISILIVLAGHLRFSTNIPPALYRVLDIVAGGGQLGVKLFFVISGFLITTLLIKEKIKTGNISLKKFYIRRFLRIFPVFYLYLLVLLVLNHWLHMQIGTISFLAAAAYLANFFMSSMHWSAMHSWSLAVEEQYYLLWPSIFKKSSKLATLTALVFIAVAPLLRVWVYYHPAYSKILLAPFIDGADGIFMGSLLAIVSFKNILPWSFFSRYKLIIGIAAFALMWFISNASLHGLYGKLLLPLGNTFTALAFSCVIISNIIPAKDVFFRLLNSRLFTFIGRLSYSIYVWQQLFLLSPAGFPGASFTWNSLPANLLLIAAVSTASYYGFEKYFLSLKSKFRA